MLAGTFKTVQFFFGTRPFHTSSSLPASHLFLNWSLPVAFMAVLSNSKNTADYFSASIKILVLLTRQSKPDSSASVDGSVCEECFRLGYFL